jgi:hypothetical protein
VLMRTGGRTAPAATVDVADRTPTGIAIGVGAAVVVGVALVAALVPVAHTAWRFALVAAAVGVFAAVTRDGWAVAATVVVAWLVVNGFLVDRMGDLSWHGSPDLLRLMLLVLVGGVGLALGEGVRGLREARHEAALRVLMTGNEEKERRDA